MALYFLIHQITTLGVMDWPNQLTRTFKRSLKRGLEITKGVGTWDSLLKFALWADRITKKQATGKNPFEMVYGMDVTLLIHLKILVYKVLQPFTTNQQAVQARIDQLVELDEHRRATLQKFTTSQDDTKKKFDKKSKPRVFNEGDLVLHWDKQHEKPEIIRNLTDCGLDLSGLKHLLDRTHVYFNHLDG
jgi:hypothetical protein